MTLKICIAARLLCCHSSKQHGNSGDVLQENQSGVTPPIGYHGNGEVTARRTPAQNTVRGNQEGGQEQLL